MSLPSSMADFVPCDRLLQSHIITGLISKNNSSARPARAFYILIHFFAVLFLTTTEMIKFDVMWRTRPPDDKFSIKKRIL